MSAMLLKRSSSNLEYPAMSFVLIFGNHHFQCFLPSKPSAHAEQIKAMPHSFIADYQPKNITARNFGTAERVRMEPSTVSIRVNDDVVKV